MTSKLEITQAKSIGNLTVELLFSDGRKQLVNVGDFIRQNPHPSFNKYLDESEFAKFRIEAGNIVWGEDWDMIFPIDQLYSGSIL